jgi:hypothetical protein
VYRRYIDDARGGQLRAAGITDAGAFTAFYWGQQLSTAGTVVLLTTVGGLIGGLAYGATRPKVARRAPLERAGA